MVTWQPGWVLPSAPVGDGVPDGALVINGDPLVINGDYLVLNAASAPAPYQPVIWSQGWTLPAS